MKSRLAGGRPRNNIGSGFFGSPFDGIHGSS
jgi:hypothetical protein